MWFYKKLETKKTIDFNSRESVDVKKIKLAFINGKI